MKTPFDAPAEAFTMSDQGLALLRYHTAHRAAMFRMIGDEAQAARVLSTKFVDLDSDEAVDALVRRMRHANSDMRAWHEFTIAVVDAEVVRHTAATAPSAELTKGLYDVDGVIYKIVQSKTSDRLYAKILEDGSFEYAAGAMRKIRPEHRMTLDEAKAYGRRTGQCCVCARLLTNPVSVAEGIGPICSGRM